MTLDEKTASVFRVKVASTLKMKATDNDVSDYITQDTTR
jgi:hypothetical protein